MNLLRQTIPRVSLLSTPTLKPTTVPLQPTRHASPSPHLLLLRNQPYSSNSNPPKTHSEEAAKADAYHTHKDPKDLQEETVREHSELRSKENGKMASSPNDQATESEEVAHATKDENTKSPKELQEETVRKASA